MSAAAGPDGRIYAIGSESSYGPGDNVAAFDPETGAWSPIIAPPSGNEFGAATRGQDGRIYAFAGQNHAVDAYNVCTGSWSEVAFMPEDRESMGVTSGLDGRVYVIGGVVPHLSGIPTNTASAYSPNTDSWAPVAPMPTARYGLSVVTAPDGTVYAIGGAIGNERNLQNVALTTVEAYSPAANGAPGVWKPVAGLNTPRYRPAASVGADGRIYVIGGDTLQAPGTGGPTSTVEVFDPQSASKVWTPLPSAMSTARVGSGAATGLDGRVYAIGGENADGYSKSVETYSTAAPGTVPPAPAACPPPGHSRPPSFSPGTWTSIAPMHSRRSQFAAATGPDGRIYAIGGVIGADYHGGVATVEAYDPRTNQWTFVKPMQQPRSGLAAATGPDGRIYAVGGGPTTVEAYDTTKDEWQYVTSLGGIFYGLGAATGTNGRIYEFGGQECPQTYGTHTCPVVADVRGYAQGDSKWREMTPMPDAANNFGMATGAGGLIYRLGGVNGSPYAGRGVETYDTTTDSWSQTVAPMLDAHASAPGASTLDGRVLAVGGAGPLLADVETFVACANRWEPLAPLLTGRTGHAGATGLDGRIYVMGGQPVVDKENPFTTGTLDTAEAYTPLPPPTTAPTGCPSVSIADAAPVSKDARNLVDSVFTVSLSHPTTQPVSVNYDTADDTARAGRDYEPAHGTLQIPAGTLTKQLIVSVDPTSQAGPATDFFLKLSSPNAIFLGTPDQATGYINSSSPPVPLPGPNVSIGDKSISRTHNKPITMLMPVSVDTPPTQNATVAYDAQAGSGHNAASPNVDFYPATGTLTFGPSLPTTQTVSIPIYPSQTTGAPDKTFSVVLSKPTNLAIGRGVGIGRIQDAVDGVSIGDVSVPEADVGVVTASFSVVLSDSLDQPVTVDYTTVDGQPPDGALAGRDYQSTTGTLRLNPGDQLTSIDVPVFSDGVPETTRNLTVKLSNPVGSGLSSRSTGHGQILELDGTPATPGTPGTPGTPAITVPGGQIPLTHSVVTTHSFQQSVQQQVQAQSQTQVQQQMQTQSQLQSQVQVQLQPGLMLERQRQIQLQKERLDGGTMLAGRRLQAAVAWAPAAVAVLVLAGFGVALGRRRQGVSLARVNQTVGRRRSRVAARPIDRLSRRFR